MKDLTAQYLNLRLVNHAENKGYGAAIRSGISAAKNHWLLIMDADGQFNIDNFKNFWQEKSAYDFILGYRKKRSDGLYRNLLGKLGTLLANLFLSTDIFIKDINCGFKLFKTNELEKIRLVSNGGVISFEIIYKLLKDKRRFTQLPVTHYSRKEGKSTGGKFKTIANIIGEFFKLTFAC